MRHIPIKLGPLALLLTVISICMTVLGLLTFTTARGDLSLAEKYGDTVRLRYELEAEGQAFLGEACRAIADYEDGAKYTDSSEISDTSLTDSGRQAEEQAKLAVLAGLEGVEVKDDGVVRKLLKRDPFTLSVGVVPDEEGGVRIVDWSIQKAWEADSGIGNLWSGE